MRAAPLSLAFATVLMAACQPAVALADPAEVRVAVMLDGRIEANGRTVTLVELGKTLDEAKLLPEGRVAYYREGPEREPTDELRPVLMAVLEAVFARGLPVRLSSKPDFSDAIDDQGRSVPYPLAGKQP